MKKKYICILFSLITIHCFADEVYYPHITINSTTLKPGQVSFQTTPGGSITSTFLINSLSVGVLQRLEIGTIPIFYLNNQHKYNFNLKWNYYKSKTFRASLGYTRILFDLSKGDFQGFQNPPTEYTLTYFSFSFNYLFEMINLQIGFTFNRAASYANNSAFIYTYKAGDEWAFDIGTEVSENYRLSFGVGEHQTEIIPTENNLFGIGATVTRQKLNNYLSNLGLGLHYIVEDKSFLYLLSANFR